MTGLIQSAQTIAGAACLAAVLWIAPAAADVADQRGDVAPAVATATAAPVTPVPAPAPAQQPAMSARIANAAASTAASVSAIRPAAKATVRRVRTVASYAASRRMMNYSGLHFALMLGVAY